MPATTIDTDITTTQPGGVIQDDRILSATLAAISRSQAIVEFRMDGTILTANENFLKLSGFSLEEIKDQHHRMFVLESERNSAEYLAFWERLRRGEPQSGEFQRYAKGGKQIWMHASYSPVFTSDGTPLKVVKFAFDITKQKLASLYAARVEAMVDNSPINTMYADRDMMLRYMNKASLETLRRLQAHLPVPVDQIVGQSIDIFHRDPAHQRKILNSAANFPRRAKFKIGPEAIDLLVNAIHDHDGNYVGAMVTWDVVTEKLATEQAIKEAEAREKQQAEQLKSNAVEILTAVRSAIMGDLTAEIRVGGDDAVGQIGVGLSEFFSALRSSFRVILDSAQTVGTSSEELNAISNLMNTNAHDTATQAALVSNVSSQVSMNVNAVAASSHEMGAAIHEIAKSAAEAARVAHNAVGVADSTNAIISQLGDSSSEIGKVIKVITSIAQQTNLLALNATIEAARAGEAGKGFAVVASEVKDLAKETARATEEIGQRIEAIQSDSKAAVGAIQKISEIIRQINDLSGTIASAVEEQTATTNEIGRSVSEAARGTNDIVENMKAVAKAAQSTTAGAAQTKAAANTLNEMARALQSMIENFKV